MLKPSVIALFCLFPLLAATQSAIGKNAFDSPWPLLPKGVAAGEGETWGELPNGLRFVVVPTDSPNGSVSLRLLVAAGRAQEPAGRLGVADAVAEMLLAGTASFDREEMLRYHLAGGMDPDSGYRSDVEIDYTVFRIDLTEPEASATQQGLDILAEFAGAPGFDSSSFEQVRASLLAKASSGLSYFEGSQAIEERALLRGSLFSEFREDDVRSGLQALTLAEAEAYWSNWYKADRMVLIVTGVVDPEGTVDTIKQRFAGLAASERLEPLREIGARFRGTGDLSMEDAPDLMGRVAVARVEPSVDLFDSAQERSFYEKDLIGRYAQADSEKSRLASSPIDLVGGALALNLFRRESPFQVLDTLMAYDRTVHRLNEFGIPGEELEEAKQAYLSSRYRYDPELGIAQWSALVAERLVRCVVDRLPFRYGEGLDRYLNGLISGLSVERVKSLCRELFEQKQLIYQVELPKNLGINPKAVAKRLKNVRKTYDFTWERAGEFETAWNLGSGFQNGGMVESTEVIRLDEYPVLQYEFANNLRMNLVRTDEFPGDVRVMVSFGNGTTEVEGQGRAFEAVVKGVLLKTRLRLGGQSPLLTEVLESKGVEDLSVGVNLDQLFWSAKAKDAQGVSDFLSTVMLWMVTGRIQEDDFEDVVERLQEARKTGLGDADGIVLEEIFGGDDLRLKTFFDQEELDAIELAGIREWVEATQENAYIEITVVGDVAPRTLLRDARNSFGSAPTRSGKVVQPRHAKPAAWREAGVREGSLERRGDSGYVTLVFPQVEEKGCVADRRPDVFRPLLQAHLREALKDFPELRDRLLVTGLGRAMVPGSKALKVQLLCPSDELDAVKQRLLEAAATFADSLTPELVAAAQRSAWIELKRIPSSPEQLVALFSQSQGRPNPLLCVLELLANGFPEEFETYRAVAGKLFSEANARVAVARPQSVE